MADFMLNVFRKVLKLRGFVKGTKKLQGKKENPTEKDEKFWNFIYYFRNVLLNLLDALGFKT